MVNAEAMDVAGALAALTEGQRLTEAEAETLMDRIMEGAATPVQIAGILIALRMRGETVEELTGFARAMRRHAAPVAVQRRPVIDTCGTGGDRSFTFNVSTVAALVAAGAGVTVAKHGNRSASSRSGSADLLESLGVNLALPPAVMGELVDEVGFGFLFAQNVHTSMRYAAGPRRELGVRTVFNILGPLTNPVAPEMQLLGVFAADWVEPLAEVLRRLGTRRAMVVHGAGGLDEVSLAGPTRYALVDGDQVRSGELTPEDLGLPRYPVEAMRGGDPAANAAICRRVLAGEAGPHLDMVLANAGVALFVAGAAADPREGVELARASIAGGRARTVLDRLVERSQAAAR
ncbi:anthranilate phosphoribosyltransferase [Candidatus Hydrogenisulfobacillus filiaventi]|uniref:Anthranilate phosphoribosyltransferase n=1 Tax=Candidatus Hydrogenisulfobacillus filiaventi TaxID=2707344 RepID=A0A6F8ZH05_9FIRM|nr:anthranilate phosphoribosyltransferase [Bacillota bacterium]CAB1129167.1 anthranilate phosphoribosyltransferase [Candidatus Hydrogenisulfobacillus filiaventi]